MAGLPDWKDAAPRLGAAYDLFGDATTALRVSWGRYNAANTYTYAEWFHPGGRQSDRRDWRDCALAPSIHADGVIRCATPDELAAIGFDPEIAFGARGGTHVGGPRGDYGTNGDDYVQDWEIGLFYPAQEAVAGGSLAWGGTHQGGALEGARAYNGNIDYIVPSSVFADQGQVRTQSFSVPLMPPGALFYDRLTQVDLSVRRTFALANGMRWELQADIYNLIDAQPILNGNNAFGTNGASLGSASSTIQGRFLQVGSHIHW